MSSINWNRGDQFTFKFKFTNTDLTGATVHLTAKKKKTDPYSDVVFDSLCTITDALLGECSVLIRSDLHTKNPGNFILVAEAAFVNGDNTETIPKHLHVNQDIRDS